MSKYPMKLLEVLQYFKWRFKKSVKNGTHILDMYVPV